MPAQTQTHDLVFTATEVHKTYVSWDRHEPDREWSCLLLLQQYAPDLAPRPLRRETRGGSPVVVMQRLPGTPLGAAPLTPSQTASVGHALRQVWNVPPDAVRAAGLPERVRGPSTLRLDVLQWLNAPVQTSRCQDPALVTEAVDAARSWLTPTRAALQPRLSVLGIADLNPANILWDGHTCRLVDFEDGGLTDPAFEFADHVEHLAGRLPGVFDVESLAEATGIVALGDERLLACRTLWASFWLAMLLPGNGAFHRNPPGTTEVQARHVMELIASV